MKYVILKTEDPVERVLKIHPENAVVRLRRILDQAAGPKRAEIDVDGKSAGTWYDPDRNPCKRLAESAFEIPPALVRGRQSMRVTFIPEKGEWTIGELRALSQVDRPLSGTPGKR